MDWSRVQRKTVGKEGTGGLKTVVGQIMKSLEYKSQKARLKDNGKLSARI
jgi:hypothetical protein